MNTKAATIRQLLDCDLDFVQRLVSLLRDEREALQNRDTDKLHSVVEDKLSVLSALQSNGRQRDRQLRLMGMDSNPRSWRNYIEQLIETDAPELRATWQSVVEHLQLIAELTEINQRLVSRTQNSVGRILSLIRGQDHRQAGTYDRLGKSRQHYDNRPIASA